MVTCLSCTPDALPRGKPFMSSRQRFSTQEALILLQKCSQFRQLKQIQAKIIRNGLCHDQILVRKMLHLCSSYGKMDYAALVFHQVQSPLTFTWNLMIRAHTINGSSQQALLLYNLMICQGVPPDKFTFPFVIKACIASFAIDKGKEVHGLAIKTGFLGDIFVLNTLMDLYFKCGDLNYGCKVFEKMPARNVVSWTTVITGLVACGEINAARAVFEQMPIRNIVSWTAMINGYARNQQPQEAFELFQKMRLENVRPNEFTLVSLIKACTELGSLKLGSWIHDFALENGFEVGVFLGTALIDMYSKCGSLEDARRVFNSMQIKSLATWNSMITSLGVHGCGEEALALFAQMEKANVQPDAITYVGVLCACVHTNNVDEGYRYFRDMTERYGIMPVQEHYTCMIELYSRADMVDEICELVKAMPVKTNDNMAASLIRESKVDGLANIGNFFYENAGELGCLGVVTCCSSQ
ncbi:hypothetical protein L1049_013258 [Liquidambar formosana]|uniref:Pentatricopeptide repeat-containing protein n=1 Tax=Liquidambar formosana TaxID=63359 RepID=A0AAP0WTY2_LIQFO